MNTSKAHLALIVGGLITALLTGCVKEQEKAPPVQYDKPADTPKPKPLVRGQNGYYGQNLDEALKTWNSCKRDLRTLEGAALADCKAARNAWHYQPYKAPKRTAQQ